MLWVSNSQIGLITDIFVISSLARCFLWHPDSFFICYFRKVVMNSCLYMAIILPFLYVEIHNMVQLATRVTYITCDHPAVSHLRACHKSYWIWGRNGIWNAWFPSGFFAARNFQECTYLQQTPLQAMETKTSILEQNSISTINNPEWNILHFGKCLK